MRGEKQQKALLESLFSLFFLSWLKLKDPFDPRIIQLIQNWIKIGFEDLNDDANFMQKLTFFVNNVLSPQVLLPVRKKAFLTPATLKSICVTTSRSE